MWPARLHALELHGREVRTETCSTSTWQISTDLQYLVSQMVVAVTARRLCCCHGPQKRLMDRGEGAQSFGGGGTVVAAEKTRRGRRRRRIAAIFVSANEKVA